MLAAFSGLSNVYAQRDPIDIYLIIDSSSSLAPVKSEVTSWVSDRLGGILADGDRVTVWSAGPSSRIVYTGTINSSEEREAAIKSISDISPQGDTADLSGALADASSRRSSSYSYTLLISVSPQSLSSLISGPQGGLLRFSRIEELSAWRAIVVGLNLNTRISGAASAFFQ